MKSYKLLVTWGFLEPGEILTTARGVGDLLVHRGMAEEIKAPEPERGGIDETNKAFQSPPKPKTSARIVKKPS